MELDIPMLMAMANELQVGGNTMTLIQRYGGFEDNKRADACIACGQCRDACPQKIDVPEEMKKFSQAVAAQKTWEEVCREREAAAAAR